MSKTKNRRKLPAKQPQGGFNHFLKEMYQTLMNSGEPALWDHFNMSTVTFKRKIYDRIIHINNPIAGNEFITPQELRDISVKIKRYYREPTVKIQSGAMSNYHLHLFMLYLHVHGNDIERQTGVKDHEDARPFNELSKEFTNLFYGRFLADCCRIVTQLSNPAKKHYSIDVRPAALFKSNPSIELNIKIYGKPINKGMVKINGAWRPIYQMGKVKFHENTKWITVSSGILKDQYQGRKDILDVYIQAHALSRLKERLDVLDQEALNYALWENTNDINDFTSYKGYLLLPFKLYDIKIGYMVANVIDEKIVFRTFLFITHNCTPEGDKLRRITGLGKHDITYWKIDRLSTFINLDINKNTELVTLLNDTGMSDLWQLKDKTFHIENMQIANLDGFMDYIKKGQIEVLEMA